MNIQGCNLAGVDAKSLYGKLAGSVNPTLGAAAYSGTWPPTGWTSLQNASADDAFVTATLNFSDFKINSTDYGTVYVGSNGYVTLGSGSTVYSSISASNPALNKLLVGASDHSYQRVAYINYNDSALIRYEGYNSAGGVSPGLSNIIWEVLFIKPFRYSTRRSVIGLNIGNAANNGSTTFGVASTSAYYANGTLAQNTSYVFEATNDTGTAWTLYTGYYIPMP